MIDINNSEYFKYTYSRVRLEQIAVKVNERLFPDRLKKISSIDGYEFLEKLNLEVEWKYLTTSGNINGIIFFDDAHWTVYEKQIFRNIYISKCEFFSKNTVVIDNRLIDKNNIKTENFACLHEGSHRIKDKKFYLENPQLIKDVFDYANTSETFKTKECYLMDVIERQTNYLASAIALPKEVITKDFLHRIGYKTIPNYPIEFDANCFDAINEISEIVGLNPSPIYYRLTDLNLIQRKQERRGSYCNYYQQLV